jgi:hypothetical protein
MKVINDGGTLTKQCNHVKRDSAYQCYGVGNPCYYSINESNPTTQWIMLIPKAYTITKANFYTYQFKLISDRYMSLISQFNPQALKFSYVKVVSTPSDEAFGNPGIVNANVALSSVKK